MNTPKAVAQVVARQVGRRFASGGHGHGHGYVPKCTYNDLPSPSGSWKTNYDALQRKYNAQLIAGVGIFAGTLLVGQTTGMFDFYNDYPEKPAVIESYK